MKQPYKQKGQPLSDALNSFFHDRTHTGARLQWLVALAYHTCVRTAPVALHAQVRNRGMRTGNRMHGIIIMLAA